MIFVPPKTPDFTIVHEDDLIVACNKKAGLLSVARDGRSADLLSLLREKFGEKIKLLHRLDRDTSGLILACKKPKFERIFVEKELHKEIKKTYLVLVFGKMKERRGEIKKRLESRDGRARVRAKTTFEVLATTREVSLVAAKIETGRKHQIRLHMAALGHPVVGDRQHGDFQLNKDFAQKRGWNKLWLHSWRLDFRQWLSKEELHLQADLPPDKTELLHALGLGRVVM